MKDLELGILNTVKKLQKISTIIIAVFQLMTFFTFITVGIEGIYLNLAMNIIFAVELYMVDILTKNSLDKVNTKDKNDIKIKIKFITRSNNKLSTLYAICFAILIASTRFNLEKYLGIIEIVLFVASMIYVCVCKLIHN